MLGWLGGGGGLGFPHAPSFLYYSYWVTFTYIKIIYNSTAFCSPHEKSALIDEWRTNLFIAFFKKNKGRRSVTAGIYILIPLAIELKSSILSYIAYPPSDPVPSDEQNRVHSPILFKKLNKSCVFPILELAGNWWVKNYIGKLNWNFKIGWPVGGRPGWQVVFTSV